jgi:sialidase-1
MNSRLSALLLFAATAFVSLTAAEPSMEKTDLFVSNTNGYKVYHIPGIVVTAKGTVLAWCEARQKGGDWDQIDIVIRRSTDGGKTFGDLKRIADVPGTKTKNPSSLNAKNVDPKDVTYNNPVLIADRDGTVHAVFCLEYMRSFYMRSVDDGVTWSTPVEITSTFEAFHKNYDWKVLATGPDHGIQLKNGRLVLPVWLSTGTGNNGHHPSVTATIFSDDQGKTWQAGDIAVPSTAEWTDPNETVIVELADSSVMLNVRNESKTQRRLITVSKDGATGWSTPKFDEALLEPICMAGIVRYSLDKPRILFCNPDNLSRADHKEQPGKFRDRKNLTVKLSYDEAKTWAVSKVLDAGWSGYSDIAVTKDGTILCFYGRGDAKDFGGYAFNQLTLARFNLEWLTDGKDSGKP